MSNVRQRTELLDGMLAFSGRLDTDSKGKYKTDSPRLKDDFVFLIRSLGGMVSLTEKKNEKGETFFYLEFELPASLSDLETGAQTTTNNNLSPLFKYITKIEFIGNKEAACIKIDSADSLYVTDDFTLTHNTAFVLSALANAAVKYDHCVAIFSLEMSAEQLLTRMMSSEAEVESQKLRNGSIADHEWAQLIHRTTQLSASKIFIDDTPAITMLELRAKARRLKSQHNLDMIVIDYLQLMSGDAGKGGGNREQEIAGISRALKQLAKELDVPVMALSQLSRAVETRGGDKKPMLSDLRESGSIEQDADMVIFLYRPEYYEITQDEMGNPTHGTAEVIIAKNRHGSLETVTLQFVGKYTKFQDMDEAGFSAGNTGYDSGFPNANDSLSNMPPIDDGFTTLQSKGNNMNPIDNDLKNNKSADFDDEPPF